MTGRAHQLARALFEMGQRNPAGELALRLHASRMGGVGEPNVSLAMEGRSRARVRGQNARGAVAHAPEPSGRAP